MAESLLGLQRNADEADQKELKAKAELAKLQDEFRERVQTKADLDKLQIDFERLQVAHQKEVEELNLKSDKQVEVVKLYESQAKDKDVEIQALGKMVDEKEDHILELEEKFRAKEGDISKWERIRVEQYLASEDYELDQLGMKADYFYAGVARNLELMCFLELIGQDVVDKYSAATSNPAVIATFLPTPLKPSSVEGRMSLHRRKV